MEDLIKLPITKSHLYKAPEIVETIRKVKTLNISFVLLKLLKDYNNYDYMNV